MPLDSYKSKRDFSRTPEPTGDNRGEFLDEPRSPSERPRFVVQEHHARRLHYDFRLEMDGVLKSWAVPKGPPSDPNARRLAVQTEDHPLSYANFSGVIAPGNYGAGTVSIWDEGTFEILGDENPSEALRRGKLQVYLHGGRLSGKYDLIRTDDERGEWLFIKPKDSAIASPPAAPLRLAPDRIAAGVAAPMPDPDSVRPMLAVTVERPFSDPAWHFEIKWDGYRALMFCNHDSSRLISRNRLALGPSFPELADLRRFLDCTDAVIDGEIVALSPEGIPQFQALQNRLHFPRRGRSRSNRPDPGARDEQIVYMAFDIIHCDGVDLTDTPLVERRRLLAGLIRAGGAIRFSDHVAGDGSALFAHLRELGMEGMMAKRADSPYVQERSRYWAKIKAHRTQDVVIAGYTESTSAGRPFAALLIGEYNDEGRLRSVGHVGSGFNQATMASIMKALDPLETPKPPFDSISRVNGKAHWVSPKLVCEVKFTEFTDDGALRHPVFLQLRADKRASECRLPESVRSESVAGGNAPPEQPTRVSSDAGAEHADLTRNAPHDNAVWSPIFGPEGAPRGHDGSAIRSVSDPSLAAAAPRSGLLHDLPRPLVAALSATSPQKDAAVTVAHHRVKLTNLQKPFWPEAGVAKRDLLRYYASLARFILPHLSDRPLVLQRYPDGVNGQSFFQHDAGRDIPAFIWTYAVEEHNGLVRYALCDDLADLLFLVNLGTIPIHTWNIRVEHPDAPDRVVFDLDPPKEVSGAESERNRESVIYVAHMLKQVLDEMGLTGFPKTSGSRGLHVVVPIRPAYTSDEVNAFARLIGQVVESRMPDMVSTERRINKRGQGTIYFDCVQNGVGKTLVAPYSVRARPTPTVSTPLSWDEVTTGLRPDLFTIDSVPERVLYRGDLMLPALQDKYAQEIGPALNALAAGYGGNQAEGKNQ